ncbi:matrix metalloproteinase-2 [Octopus sinensis]|nr:matrix metalloproteinase-2 [Octopus sinensis]
MEFGYVNGPSLEMENLMSEEAQVKAIRRFQAFANLPLTGRLDHRTIEWMEKPRCGNKDTLPDDTWGNARKKRYVISGSQWEKTNLTFRFLNYSPDVKFTKIRTVIYEAFRVWSQVTHLTFTEIMFGSAKKDADIRIMFAQKFHHDGYPFDGPGNILAHAFFPGENKGGDAHFDDDENWTVDSDEGVNLFMVAAHEFGHALGLSHSKTPGSLMYPWYAGKQSKYYTLPKDDVEGIQKLYGVKNSNNTPVIVLVPNHEGSKDDKEEKNEEEEDDNKDEGFVDDCTHKFDAITRIRGDVYIFKGKYFWRWESGGMKDSSPILITQFWYNYPEDSVDAVFERKKGSKIMFFKGNKYWLYDANHMEKAWPIEGRPLTELGLPADLKKIDAAFTWSYNKRTYLVSDDMYWKFDENENYVVYDYPRDMKIWQGVPTPLDAAFQFNDGKTYFIKGKHYWEFLDSQMRVKTKQPTGNNSERWMQCKTPPKNIGFSKPSHEETTPSKGFSAHSLMALPNLVLLSLLTSYL